MPLIAKSITDSRPIRLEIDRGRIGQVIPASIEPLAAEKLPWVAPGLLDIQINGFGGQEFSSLELTPALVSKIVRQHYAFGVTRVCPTLTTQSREVFEHGCRAIADACETDSLCDRSVLGIHLEGPYLSPEDGPRGAHPREHCRPPNWDEFQRWQQVAGGRVRLMTLAPEWPGSAEFIARATAAGVVIAIGHTAATGEQIRAAVDAGARLSTHLGNGAHRQLRRHPNYLWDQLAEDRLSASLIVDGHHLPAEVVQTFVRAKSPARTILVSDVSGLAGLPVGRYFSSGCELEILPDGRLVIAGQDQLLAGASLPLGVGIVNVMRFAQVDLPTAIAMASSNPARLLGAEASSLEAGSMADLVLFDLPKDDEPASLRIRATLVGGELVYGELSNL